MRFPRRRLWRAYRRLDGFDEATRKRVYRSAERASRAPILFSLVFVVPVGVVLGIGGAVASGLLFEEFISRNPSYYLDTLVELVVFLGLSLSVPIVTRELISGFALRRTLATTEACPRCGYPFVGQIPLKDVQVGVCVRCPECGEVVCIPMGAMKAAQPPSGAGTRAGEPAGDPS